MDVQKAFAEALLFHQKGELGRAQLSYQTILKANPHHLDSLHLLGVASFQMGDLDRAKNLIEAAISLNSQVAVFHLNLGNVYYAARQFEEAKKAFKQTVALDPKSLFGWTNLGNTFQELKRPLQALEAYEKASLIQENAVEVLIGFSSAYEELADFKKAEDYCLRALKLCPDHAQILSNLGLIYQKQKRFEEALHCFSRALEKSPQLHQVHLLKAETYFLQNNWKQGFEEYDGRLQDPRLSHLSYSLEKARAPLTHQKILIAAEQGLGDSIQFVRFVRQISDRAPAKIDLFVQDDLRKLFEVSFSDDPTVHILRTSPQMEDYDLVLPMMSLPRILQIENDAGLMPSDKPYLRVSDSAQMRAANFVGPKMSDTLKVGLKWQGDKNFKGDRFRSITLETFAPLLSLESKKIDWISLQKGFGEEQISSLPQEHSSRIKVYESSNDRGEAFEETAAMISNLDLVITTDSSVAHLAGALQIPTWLLLAPVPGWRWGLEGEKTPWYPQVKIYRATQWGDWKKVIQDLGLALKS